MQIEEWFYLMIHAEAYAYGAIVFFNDAMFKNDPHSCSLLRQNFNYSRNKRN